MAPKLLCGLLLTLVGLVFSSICFIYAVMNPWNYNGINGLLGSFLGTQTLVPFIISTAAILLGIFRLFWKSKEVVYVPTGSIAKERSIFFDLKHMDKLTDLVNSGSFSADSKIKSEASGNIRMDVILSADNKFAAVQLFQFVPYTYQPVTAVHYFTNDAAAAVAAFLTKSQLN